MADDKEEGGNVLAAKDAISRELGPNVCWIPFEDSRSSGQWQGRTSPTGQKRQRDKLMMGDDGWGRQNLLLRTGGDQGDHGRGEHPPFVLLSVSARDFRGSLWP